jgi:hypothetical protein
MILDLPDELIEYILTFVTERDLARCRQVDRTLYIIANNPYLIKQFPHLYVHGSLYLKEHAYFTPTIRHWILKTHDTNDLDWLISRTTPIINEVFKGDMMAWALMIALYHYEDITSLGIAASYIVYNAAISQVWAAAWAEIWHSIWCNVHIKEMTKSYQIDECIRLININTESLLRVKTNKDKHLKGVKILLSDSILQEHKHNPWIKQYHYLMTV